ncbi:TlpA family protein disulfide reductase [[Archangium] primigenium]|jgi:thiol-disulfide isomerase/thioredoxin|uniref:TlpA family protein disulfide reductase n=1 Tax=Melittangium TaxID=44 RepID=UPI001957A403|nr:TlpA disulfide reductase family protein [Archangium primigenium]MBM7116566.1 TlpA family protein disulfide reductase [Archangium primigenium]
MSRGRALARVGVLLLALAGCHREPEAPRLTGTASPYLRALVLPAVGPTPYDWRELPGRVVLVSFFATWSFPSLAQLPTLEALQKELGPQGLRVVLVGLDLDGPRTLAPFAQDYAPAGVPLLVSNPALQQGQSAYGLIPALPATFLLDKEGRVAGAWQGMAGHGALSDAVQTLLRR